jgi:hypothetical protein
MGDFPSSSQIALRRVTYSSAYFQITVEPRFIVRLYRSPVEFPAAADIDQEASDLERALAGVHRSRYGLLADMRDGPLTLPRAFDPAYTRLIATVSGFVREAVLVRDALGMARGRRMSRDARTSAAFFTREDEAIVYLRGPDRAHAL